MTLESQMPPAVPLSLFFPGPSAGPGRAPLLRVLRAHWQLPVSGGGVSVRSGSLGSGPGRWTALEAPARDSERAPPPPHCGDFMRPDLRLIPSLQLRAPSYIKPPFWVQGPPSEALTEPNCKSQLRARGRHLCVAGPIASECVHRRAGSSASAACNVHSTLYITGRAGQTQREQRMRCS